MSKRIGFTVLAGLVVAALTAVASPMAARQAPATNGAAVAGAATNPAATAPATPPAPVAAAVPAGPTPKLVAVEAVKDVGKVAKGEKVKVDFEIRNEGQADLLINNVHPTCGCTVASFDEKIAPGTSGKIHAEIDTVDFSGPIAKSITVISNDPVSPRITLTIKAKVEPQIYTFPGYARYVYVQSQPATTVKQWLWTDGSVPDFKILQVTSPYKFIHTTFRPATAEERRAEAPTTNQWIIESTIQPDAEVGALRDFLLVETNHPKQKELRLAITGFVRPLMSVTPFVADFGKIDLGAASQDMSLVLVNFGDEAIEIRGVTASVPGVEATIKPIEAGKRYEVKLTLTGAMPKGHVDATLKIRTTSKLQPEIELPLRGDVL